MKRGRAETIIEEVQTAVKRWPDFAAEARLGTEWGERIGAQHRLGFQP